jgi:hypothetical protein
VFILREKHKGFEPKILWGKTSRGTRAFKQKGQTKTTSIVEREKLQDLACEKERGRENIQI